MSRPHGVSVFSGYMWMTPCFCQLRKGNNTVNIVQNVSRILDENYVTYGLLKIDSSNYSKHYIVTDEEKVFVKLLKPDSDPTKLQNEVNFAMNTLYGTNPLLESVYHRTDMNTPMLMSAWEWERRYPVGVNMNVIQAATAANELFKIHSSYKYPELLVDVVDEYIRYGEELASHSFTYLNADNQNRLKVLFMKIIRPYTDLLGNDRDQHVVSHGHAVPEKLMVRNDYSVFWSDYEESRSAPREYDLSFLYLSLKYRMGKPELWDVVRTTYENLSQQPLNEERLNMFASLILARHALKLSSQTLHTQNEDGLNRYLKDIEPLIKGASVESLNLYRK